MRRVLIALALCACLATPSEAAITVVSGQEATGSNNVDYTLTFPSPWGASNHVIVVAAVYSAAGTVDLTSITNAEVVLHDDATLQSNTRRIYIWCFQGDGTDNTVTLDQSGGVQVRSAAIEIAGGSCTESGTSVSGNESATPFDTPTLTTSTDGAFMFGIWANSSVIDIAAGTNTSPVPSDDSEIGTVAQAGYRIAGAASGYTLQWTTGGSPSTGFLAAAAVQESGGGGGGAAKQRLIRGIGEGQ
jgi:hypothetical protein